MPTAESKIISITIQRSLKDVYDFTAWPASFARWASGLGKPLGNEGNVWHFEGENGLAKIRFTEPNEYGVLDHYVELPDGSEIYIPMRIIANGTGSEVQFTLFRVPGMSDDKFAADEQWIVRDLNKLKALLEAQSS
ncbi:SRPBCC family protein [Paraburkholderia sp. Ac-20336]|uniref:SRPBCC family protein n=1 Tax=Paraburkholderia sp. Ac-20336 TaxID=2703886 RepID=UPI00197EA39B|nr:SRPBCC family protein [Paraburkholderia sp. Ac-20336]MBN3806343.1 SRPBCC family protein [Paraburkholderia sp. Ac-20336]